MIKKVRYKYKYYAVISVVKYNIQQNPIVLDWDNYKLIRNMKKKWKCDKTGMIYCYHKCNDISKKIFLHDIVVALYNKKNKKKIVHINNIGADNRYENLLIQDKIKYKKKTRTMILHDNLVKSNIKLDDIPSYICYMKPDKSHGDRFIVDVPGLKSWKTSSSNKINTIDKFNIAVEYLDKLKIEYPDKFNYNNDIDNSKIKKLTSSYYQIIKRI
jgi:hypothetical protein